ncbi:palmitoyltransferase akr1 [Mycoemilia scoparia]|uniref:Palmitoyltransferase n=1 Tax=Mycoemilia scoparia TaxID=417184 RepID=A0A9W8A839_9FUNG|nr:palmitoyltransferase akr1 [Mycoemilia scoparia]
MSSQDNKPLLDPNTKETEGVHNSKDSSARSVESNDDVFDLGADFDDEPSVNSKLLGKSDSQKQEIQPSNEDTENIDTSTLVEAKVPPRKSTRAEATTEIAKTAPQVEFSTMESGGGNSGDLGEDTHPQTELQDKEQQSGLTDIHRLMIAAQRNDVDGVRYWIETAGMDPYVYDETATALHWAAFNGSMDVIVYLITEAHVNPNQLDIRAHASPIFWACNQGHLETMDYLLAHGADPTVRDSSGYSLLHAAVQIKSPTILLYLVVTQLHAFGNTVDVPDNSGLTPLIWAVSMNCAPIVSTLLRLGANPNHLTKQNQTALHFSVTNATRDIIEGLVKYGGDMNLKPAMMAAPGESNDSAAEGILNETPLEIARRHNRGALVEGIIERVDAHNKVLADAKIFGHTIRSKIGVFLAPFAGVGLAIYFLSIYPWFFGLPFFAAFLVGMHYSIKWLLRWPQTPQRIQKSPYYTAIFQATAFYVLLTWNVRVVPVTLAGSFNEEPKPTYWLANLIFGGSFAAAMWFFYKSMYTDPGYLPYNEVPSNGIPGLRRLIEKGKFDLNHFCRTCLDVRPLRSKHCRQCDRCVSRFDHHCPWVFNCVGLHNHRSFILYLIFMTFGIGMYLFLTVAYMDIVYVYYDPIPGQPCYLGDTVCGMFQSDGWTFYLAIWTAINLSWSLALLGIQLFQIASGVTTNEKLSPRNSKRNGSGSSGASTAKRILDTIPGMGGSGGDDQSPEEVESGNIAQNGNSSTLSKVGRKLSPFAVALPCLRPFLGHKGGHRHGRNCQHHNHGHGTDSQMEAGNMKQPERYIPSFNFGVSKNCESFWSLDRKGPLSGIDWTTAVDADKWVPPPDPISPQTPGYSPGRHGHEEYEMH